jgi:hypothetical protein
MIIFKKHFLLFKQEYFQVKKQLKYLKQKIVSNDLIFIFNNQKILSVFILISNHDKLIINKIFFIDDMKNIFVKILSNYLLY